METTTKPLMGVLRSKLKQASLLWFEGFREACCLHRDVILCLRSKMLSIRTGQCFLLNGFIFLGSIFILNSVVIPTLQWILPDQCPQIISSQDPCPFRGVLRLYSFLRLGLIQLFYVFWFYPLYIFSFILSNIWYNDIAKYGFVALGRTGPTVVESSSQKEGHDWNRRAGLFDTSVELLLPRGLYHRICALCWQGSQFLFLSWMYAYYCFEYKWNLSEVGLDKRLDFFESNWAFFAGFGNPCVLAIFFVSPLVSYGVMAILFPLQQARRMSKLFLLKEESGEVQAWEGFQFFMQQILYRCLSCLFSPWNLENKSKTIRHSKKFGIMLA